MNEQQFSFWPDTLGRGGMSAFFKGRTVGPAERHGYQQVLPGREDEISGERAQGMEEPLASYQFAPPGLP